MADSDLYLTVRNEAVNNLQYPKQPGNRETTSTRLWKSTPVRDNPIQTGSISLLTTKQPYKTTRFRFPAVAKDAFLLFFGILRPGRYYPMNRFRRYSPAPMSTTTSPTPSRLGCPIALSKTINNRVPNDNVGNGIFTRSIEQRPFDVPFKEDGRYMIGGVDIPRHNGSKGPK